MPRIEAGTVWANARVLLAPNMPYCGVKQSGTRREFGRVVIEVYSAIKLQVDAHRSKMPPHTMEGRQAQSVVMGLADEGQ